MSRLHEDLFIIHIKISLNNYFSISCQDVVDRVAEIEERHTGILMIEEGVKEVHVSIFHSSLKKRYFLVGIDVIFF